MVLPALVDSWYASVHKCLLRAPVMGVQICSLPRCEIRIVLFLLFVLLFPAYLCSQFDHGHVISQGITPAKHEGVEEGSTLQTADHLRADASLVLVPVTVRDALNRPVLGLKKNDFNIYENNKHQDLQVLWKEDAPVSVGIILDFSESMSNKVEMERSAVREFFNNANPQDDYFVVAVSDRPHLIADSTDSIDNLEQRIEMATPSGNTALLDAIYVGLAKMRSARYRCRALLIISDGGDNHSYYNAKHIKRLAQEADVLMYSIGIFDNMPIPVFKTIEEKLGEHLLTTITELTGGYTVAADDREKVPEIAATVSRALRERYVLAYKPQHILHDGKWKRIRVEVIAPESPLPLHVDYKKGYIAPE